MKNTDPLLVVEDQEALRTLLRTVLAAEGFEIEEARDLHGALRAIGRRRFALVLTDLRLPDGDGQEVLSAALGSDPGVPVILLTAYGTVSDAVAAMKRGAFDFLEKPIDNRRLVTVVRKALTHGSRARASLVPGEPVSAAPESPDILGESAALRAALDQVRRVATTDATVMLTGESGTGKELFARQVHHLSGRRRHPLVAINCAAIPETLLESELFGHEKGAFTGAIATKRGKLEIADRGTLFLDEIADLPPVLQGKVLRALEEKRFERVGGNETRSVDFRLIAATNRNLGDMVATGAFRGDLFYRLSVFPIVVPPLRNRGEDIPLLARHFIARFAAEQKRAGPVALSPEARKAILDHPWPGNVRELENTIERALILGEGSQILPEHLRL
jgi:DNA-binding NtrC family response regulator